MAVSKEIAEKVKRFQQLETEANQLFDELQGIFNGDDFLGDMVVIGGVSISDNPSKIAEPTENGEFNQIVTRYEDSVDGCYFVPIEDSNEFVAVSYST